MKTPTLLGAMLVLVLLLSACGPATTAVPTNTVEPTMATTDIPAVTESPVATEPAATEPAATGVPVTGEATVNVSQSTDFGPILVDGNGMALYVFMSDIPDSGTSACTGDCAVEWLPLLSQGSPAAGAGLDAALLGTLTRDDGTLQVTYNGYPLYLFHEDMAAGDTNGQAVTDEFGQWFLVSPAGAPIQQ